MAGWFDHERDLVAESQATIRVPDYDDLTSRTLEELRALRHSRRTRLIVAIAVLVGGVPLAAVPNGIVVILGGILFVAGLVSTPVSVYLLRSATRELARREFEATVPPVTGTWAD